MVIDNYSWCTFSWLYTSAAYIYLFTSLFCVMWLTVSFICISIFLFLLLNASACYISVSTCLIFPARATCFWNPITQKFAVKFQSAYTWLISRTPCSLFWGLKDLRVESTVCRKYRSYDALRYCSLDMATLSTCLFHINTLTAKKTCALPVVILSLRLYNIQLYLFQFVRCLL